jgi:hypothetical protein
MTTTITALNLDRLPKGHTITLAEEMAGLPAGTKITHREYSWAIELPGDLWGYLSCGTTLENAIAHALSGAPEKALKALTAFGDTTSAMLEAA